MNLVNSVVVSDSARTRIRKALIHQLKSIRTSAGYNYDIVEVRDITPSLQDLKIYPSIVVVMGDERTLDSTSRGSTFDRVQKGLTVLIHAFLSDGMSQTSAQDRIIQDVERMIGEHHGLEHEDGQCTCSLAQVVQSRPFGLSVNKPNCGVTITLSIRYQQLRLDPTQKV